MHYQTCRDFWSRFTAGLRPAGVVANRQQHIRLILFAGIGVGLAVLLWPTAMPIHMFHGSETGNTVPVLVAKRYLSAFEVIKANSVEVHLYPPEFVPPGALNNPAELQNESGQSVYASVVSISEGQPLTRTVLIDAAQKQRMASLIRAGRVAVSFAVDKAHAAGGWVRPGDTIGVFETPLIPMSTVSATSKRATRLLFDSLHVLAVDSARVGQGISEVTDEEKNSLIVDPAADDGSRRIITVLATPGEAADLLDAREKGSLSVVLRALGDDLPWPTVK